MADSWDDDEYTPEINLNQSGNIKVNWEDEEDETILEEERKKKELQEKAAAAAASSANSNNNKNNNKLKKIDDATKMEQIIQQMKNAELKKETVEEKKAREKKAIEEADFEMAMDVFQDKKVTNVTNDEMEKTIHELNVNNLETHMKFGEIIGNKIADSNPKYIVEFFKNLVLQAHKNLSADDVKDLSIILNAIRNEKISSAKPKGKKKKAGGKQTFAKVERDNDLGFNGRGETAAAAMDDVYDDDVDFM